MLARGMFACLRRRAQLPNDAARDRLDVAQIMGPKADDAPAGFTERH
jgi:hypothetical protein